MPVTPLNIDSDDPLSLFLLFLPVELWNDVVANINKYAELHHRSEGRPWQPVSFNEVMVFIGGLLYMGLYHEPQIESYWHTAHPLKPLHPICNHMSLSHFEQIKHYLHILPPMSGPLNHKPTPKEEVREGQLESKWWHKLDPMISQFQSASEQYYIPGSKIAIDKVMIKTYGQSLHTFKMPNKPIPQGFKIYALADHGYIFTFTPASHTASLAEIVKSSDMTMTGSMVLELISHLPGLGYQYTLYLDNYFTSVGLFKLLCS